MFSHILIPTDGSEHALHAAEMGIALAHSLGARVYAFHVLMPLPAVAYLSDVIRHAQNSHEERAVARAQRRLADVEVLAEQAGVPCAGGYAFDHRPYVAIVGAAKRQHCDLIVMSVHGYATLDRMLLGSETNRVLGCCNIPVLVCH